MDIFIQLIFILALIKYALKAALTNNIKLILCYGAFASIVALLLYPFVIEQPVTILSSLLADARLVENGAVITTIEAVAGIFVSVYLLDNYFVPRTKRKKSLFVLKILPGILSCVAILYFELLFFKWQVGADFVQSAAIYSAMLFVGVVGMAMLLRYLVKGESLKLELKVLLNIGILATGLLVNCSVADYNLSHAQSHVEWGALIVLVLLAGILFFVGIYMPRTTSVLKTILNQK